MRKAWFVVFLFIICAGSAFADCSNTLRIGADPKDLNRQLKDGEYILTLAAPLCVDENAGHKSHVVGSLPVGTEIVVRHGDNGKVIPVWVKRCGNDINKVLSDHIESYAERREEYRDSDYYDDGVPVTNSTNHREERSSREAWREGQGQSRSDDRYMTREEFLAAIAAMNKGSEPSKWDRFWTGFDRAIAVGGVYMNYRTYRALSKPIRVKPVGCYGLGCGRPTPPPQNSCPTCTPGPPPPLPCLPGNVCH